MGEPPLAATIQNAFDLLGLPPRFELDAEDLRRVFLKRSREVHPDRFVASPPAERAAAERRSAHLNDAYETLRDPLRRAEHLLALAGGPNSTQERTVPQAVLTETLVLREEIDDAQSAGDAARLAALRGAIESSREGVLARIAALAARLPGDASAVAPLRLELNSIRYYDRMLEQLA
jgi:molecular chaperone HscB